MSILMQIHTYGHLERILLQALWCKGDRLHGKSYTQQPAWHSQSAMSSSPAATGCPMEPALDTKGRTPLRGLQQPFSHSPWL